MEGGITRKGGRNEREKGRREEGGKKSEKEKERERERQNRDGKTSSLRSIVSALWNSVMYA